MVVNPCYLSGGGSSGPPYFVEVYSDTAAATADTTKLWIDPDTKVMRYYSGTAWVPIAGTWG